MISRLECCELILESDSDGRISKEISSVEVLILVFPGTIILWSSFGSLSSSASLCCGVIDSVGRENTLLLRVFWSESGSMWYECFGKCGVLEIPRDLFMVLSNVRSSAARLSSHSRILMEYDALKLLYLSDDLIEAREILPERESPVDDENIL